MTSTKSHGGIERYSLRLAAALRARGVPLVYACRPGGFVDARCQSRGIPTAALPIRNSGDAAAVWRLARLIVRDAIDIVHVHSRRDYLPALLGVVLARHLWRVPVRLVLHAHMVRSLGSPPRPSGWLFARAASVIVAVSGAVRDKLRHDYDFSPDFVRLIYNGVETAEFAVPGTTRADAWREAHRRAWGVPMQAPVIGMVGRLDAKGQASLLAVLPDLVRRHPDLRLVFVGAEGLLGEESRLRAQVGTLAGHIIFTGMRDDIPALMASFDLLVHLPLDEAFGLALVEAMASGLPTVATDIGGCREVVRNGVTGLLVPPGDGASLRDSILCLLDDPVLRARMGDAGRALAGEEFSMTHQIDRLQDLYHELCSGTPSPS